jgi:hypothetical protein
LNASIAMAETAPAEPSAASQLLQQHAANSHHVTVEDEADEDLGKPVPAADASAADSKPSWAEPTSVKAAGKQKAQEAAGLDTQSHELFPELGGPKPKASAGVVPVWSAKTGVNGKANGASSANGTPHASAPASGVTTPTGIGSHKTPMMALPGRNVETMFLEPQHVIPRAQLRRPIPDIIKEVNRKSRANVTMTNVSNGKIKLEAAGPQDVAFQALKDLMNQIGTKVCTTHVLNRWCFGG